MHDKDGMADKKQQRLKASPITLEQYLRDQLSKYQATDTVENIIKFFDKKNLTVTEANHDTQRPVGKLAHSETVG